MLPHPLKTEPSRPSPPPLQSPSQWDSLAHQGVTCVCIPSTPHGLGSHRIPRARCLAHRRGQEPDGWVDRWVQRHIYTHGHTPDVAIQAHAWTSEPERSSNLTSGCSKVPWPRTPLPPGEVSRQPALGEHWSLLIAKQRTGQHPPKTAVCWGLGGPQGLLGATQGGGERQSSHPRVGGKGN